jgi:hypothetical protein
VDLVDRRLPTVSGDSRAKHRGPGTPLLAVQLFREGALDERAVLRALSELAAIGTVSPHLLAAALSHLGLLFREGGEETNGSQTNGD